MKRKQPDLDMLWMEKGPDCKYNPHAFLLLLMQTVAELSQKKRNKKSKKRKSLIRTKLLQPTVQGLSAPENESNENQDVNTHCVRLWGNNSCVSN